MGRTKKLAAGVQILLGLVYLAAGLPKVVGAETPIEQFEKYGFPHWFCRMTGIFETLGAAGLFCGLVRPVATVVASLVLVPTMVVAAFVHRRHPEDSDALSIAPGALVALLGTVTCRNLWLTRTAKE